MVAPNSIPAPEHTAPNLLIPAIIIPVCLLCLAVIFIAVCVARRQNKKQEVCVEEHSVAPVNPVQPGRNGNGPPNEYDLINIANGNEYDRINVPNGQGYDCIQPRAPYEQPYEQPFSPIDGNNLGSTARRYPPLPVSQSQLFQPAPNAPTYEGLPVQIAANIYTAAPAPAAHSR